MIEHPPDDLDTARAGIAANGLTAAASAHLTEEVALKLPFEALGPYKALLRQFFSDQPWTDADADELSALVAPHLDENWWEHPIADEHRLAHGLRAGRYELWVTGGSATGPSLFDRVFAGPVIPEATPHPRKVKFNLGGVPAPGRWYQRGDDAGDEPIDERVTALLAADDVTDVMVAGDFVTIGLERTASWEERLDAVLAKVTELFGNIGADEVAEPARSRDQLVAEGLAIGRRPDAAELHLLDPDDPDQRDRLEAVAAGNDARLRRLAIVTLAQSHSPDYVATVLNAAYLDEARIVRRAAVDAAADVGLRSVVELALTDEDSWSRWKAVRALRDLGLGPSRQAVAALADDPDFRVRLEVEAALRG